VERILVRGTNWLGDAVLTIPALQALRSGFPHARIALLLKPAVAELFQHHPAVDEIILYRDPGPHAGLGGKLALARQLSRGRYDLAVLFQNAFEAAAITALAGIPNRYGYATDGRWFLLTHRVPMTPGLRRRHQAEYYLELLRPLGIPIDPVPPTLRTTPEEDAAAGVLLSERGVTPGRTLIGLNPGSTYGAAKRWIPERYAEVADRLAAEHDGHVLIFGGRGEEPLGAAIAGMMRSPVTVLSGRTTVRQLVALIKPCRLFLTNDTGPMHIAAALGVPLVAIYGPTDPVTTAPFGKGHELIRKPVDCSPCLLRECPIDHRCMQGITVDMVYEAAAKQLAGLSRASGLSGSHQTNQTSPLHGGVVFLDRDGTLNLDPGYLNHPDAVRLLPGVGPAVARLNAGGFKTVVVSNQSGVGRGLIEPHALEAIHHRMRQLLAEDGGRLDGIYVCPHRPEEGCACRKPAPGLVARACEELGVSAKGSWVVGDKATDVELARNVGATAVFVASGARPGEERAKMSARGLTPDYEARDLGEAVEWILAEVEIRSTLTVKR
jgi:heptosyltransferase-2